MAKTPPKNRASAKKAQTRTIAKKRAFLAAYRVCASVKQAAKAVPVDRVMHYRWLRSDADYHVEFREAVIEAADALQDEAVERAMVGVFEPNVFQGRFVYPQEEYVVKEAHGREPEVRAWRDKPGARPLGIWRKSDALLMFLLRGMMPEKYKYFTSVELGGGPMEIVARLQAARARVAGYNLSKLNDDELTNLRILAEKLSAEA